MSVNGKDERQEGNGSKTGKTVAVKIVTGQKKMNQSWELVVSFVNKNWDIIVFFCCCEKIS